MTASAACAGRPAPAISPATRVAVDRAERSERARRYDQARAWYERAERDAPDARSRAWAARQYADALAFWGEYRDAERALERVVRWAPGDASAWHDLGILRARRGDVAGAEMALRRAKAAAPHDPRPRVALAALWVNARRFDAALAEYRALLALDLPPRLRAAVRRAIALVSAETRRAPSAAPAGSAARPPGRSP